MIMLVYRVEKSNWRYAQDIDLYLPFKRLMLKNMNIKPSANNNEFTQQMKR